MPRLRKPKSKLKAKTSTDPITNLFQKLPPKYQKQIPHNIQNQLITKTQETLRLFNSKLTRGQALCKGDSQEARSAVVFEYVLRQGFVLEDGLSELPSVRIPLVVLGKCVGTGKKEVEQVGNFAKHTLDAIKMHLGNGNGNASGNSNAKSNSNTKGGGNGNRHNTNAARNLNIRKTIVPSTRVQRTEQQIETLLSSSQNENNTIHTLSIVLQSLLHDPNNIEHKSQILWRNIIQYKLKSKMKNAVVRDLELNSKCYEGACFYYTVHDLEQGSLSLNSTTTNPNGNTRCHNNNNNNGNKNKNVKGRKGTNKMNGQMIANNNGGIVDDDMERNLTIHDIIYHLKVDDSTFPKILDDVTSSAKYMGRTKYVNSSYVNGIGKAKVSKKRSRNEREEDTENQDSTADATGKHKKSKTVEDDHNATSKSTSTPELRLGDKSFDKKDHQWNRIPNISEANYLSKETFMEWKEKILRETLTKLKADNDHQHDSNTDHQSSVQMTGTSIKIKEFEAMKTHAQVIRERYRKQNE